MLVTSISQEKHDETTTVKKEVLLQLQKNYLKRIIFWMVITFVFTMKARFVKIYHFSYIYTLIFL